jgi:hypothetical protein
MALSISKHGMYAWTHYMRMKKRFGSVGSLQLQGAQLVRQAPVSPVSPVQPAPMVTHPLPVVEVEAVTTEPKPKKK